MRRHPFNAELFTPRRVRVGASIGAVVICAALVGATAAPAATHPTAPAAPAARGLLQIRFATPEPVVIPPAPPEGDRLAVLADPPADLAFDADLQSSRDLAMIRQTDALQAHDAQVQARLWAAEEARMQAQIEAAMRPLADVAPTAPKAATRAGPTSDGDPDIAAAAGDTRKASTFD